MATKTQYFIKLFDEKIAKALCDGGFSYVKENVTVTDDTGNRIDKTLYSFVGSKKLERTILKLAKSSEYIDFPCTADLLLRF